MNTKFQLPVIIIAALFVVTSSFTVAVHLSKEKNTSTVNNNYVDKAPGGNVHFQNLPESNNILIHMVPISHSLPAFNGVNMDDDGITHHFHFGRIRKARRYARIFCFLAKMIIIITHAALLICGYCHVINH